MIVYNVSTTTTCFLVCFQWKAAANRMLYKLVFVASVLYTDMQLYSDCAHKDANKQVKMVN